MTEVKDVTGTAFVVAEFRARENAEPHPLYRDPIVPIFLDERTKRAADAIRADFPAAEKMPRLRTRYFDDRLDEQLANGCRQVVILGSGLDTRAVRKRKPDVAYFEIDDPSTVSFKRGHLAERGIDAPINFIAGDYVAAGVLPLLEANGFNCDLPSFFIWEGNTMYLTEADAMKVLGTSRGVCAGSASPSTTWTRPWLRGRPASPGRRPSWSASPPWARPGTTASTILILLPPRRA